MASGDNFYPYGTVSLSKGTTIADALQRLGTRFEEVPLVNGKSNFVRPCSLLYELDGKERRWDAIEAHDSVGVCLYHRSRAAFLMVRQFRPAVYATELRTARAAGAPAPALTAGFTFELCAGLMDKSKPIKEIVKEEIEEETGFSVGVDDISFITTAISAIGTTGAKHHMFYAEVDDSMRVEAGGGLLDHGEVIEVVALPLANATSFILDDSIKKSPGLMFAMQWAQMGIMSGKLGKGTAGGLMTDTLELKPVVPA